MSQSDIIPHTVSWNITYRCNQNCSHCYLDAGERTQAAGELSTVECKRIVNELAGINSSLCLILTGGEPLLRRDIFEISGYARGKGLTVFLGTNGTYINEDVVNRLIDSGVSGVGISVDSMKEDLHDAFRGLKGSWKKAVDALHILKRKRLPSVIQFSVMDFNRDEIEDMVRFAISIGHRILNIYFLVCTGRGEKYSDMPLDRYEEVLKNIAALQSDYGEKIWLNVKCAPSYKRVLFQLDGDSRWLKSYKGGCPAGIEYLRVTPEGLVTPCPYMDLECGNLKETSFSELWHRSKILEVLRKGELKGRCGRCRYSSICIGCRARALVKYNDYMEEDDLCSYMPYPGEKKVRIGGEFYASDCETTIEWTEDAVRIMERIPSFARSIVIKRVEQKAQRMKQHLVDTALLKEMAPFTREGIKNRGILRQH